jgi:lipoprotein NlpD
MLQRSHRQQLFIGRLIVISIMFLGLMACGSPQPAQVIDRTQPPSRKIQGQSVHYVSRGETLFSIAWRYGLDYRLLANYNKIPAPYTIYPGQKINLDISPSRRLASSSPSASPSANTASQPRGASATPAPRVTPTQPVTTPRSEIKTPAVAPPSKPPLISGAVQWQWPTQGVLLSGFHGNNGLNKGIDIGGNLGQPVLAAASGQIVYAGSGLRGYGKLLIIKHNETFLSAYAHNHHLLVKEGDTVKAGQKIADMGSSGTDRVKLHFEIRREGTPVDPMKYLPKR